MQLLKESYYEVSILNELKLSTLFCQQFEETSPLLERINQKLKKILAIDNLDESPSYDQKAQESYILSFFSFIFNSVLFLLYLPIYVVRSNIFWCCVHFVLGFFMKVFAEYIWIIFSKLDHKFYQKFPKGSTNLMELELFIWLLMDLFIWFWLDFSVSFWLGFCIFFGLFIYFDFYDQNTKASTP